MYYTYILKSKKDGQLYAGSTNNLRLRFEQHKKGAVPATKHRRPLELIYYEACLTEADARRRERTFKSYRGKMFLKNRLKSYFTGLRFTFSIRTMRKFRIIIILISILAGFLIAPPLARAGLVIKLPSSLGLATNLQGYWTFDGADMYENGTVAADKSGNGNNGAVTGARVGPGKIGQALKFDGVDDNVSLGNYSVLDGSTYASWSFWVKPDAIQASDGNEHAFISRWNANDSVGRSWLITNNDTGGGDEIYLYTSLADGARTNTNALTVGQWKHVAIVYDGTQTTNTTKIKIYINGTEVSAYVSVGTVPTTLPTPSVPRTNYIGSSITTDTPIRWTKGLIDEVRVYSRALSAPEIKRLYNMGSGIKTASQTSKITSGLLAYYTFDGADVYENGAVVADKSGNGNNGAVTGARVGPGKIGQALHFDGINDLVNTGSDFIGTSALTISVWVYRENAAGTQRIVSNNRTILSTNTAGRILFSSDGATTISSGNNCADAGKWTHVVVTRTSSGVANFYCSSAQYGTADQASGTPTAGTENVFLGNRGSGAEPWDGPLDEIRIYNRVLSAAEIKELYNQGAGAIAGKTQDTQLTTNLVGYWPFNGPDIYESGTVAADKSGQGNNGALSGFTAATGAVPGKIGQGLRFDGVNDFIASGDIDVSDITVSAWIKANGWGDGGTGTIISKLNTFVFAINDGTIGVDTLIFYDGDEWEAATASGIALGQWYFVTATANSTTVTFYINGVQAGSNVGIHTLGSTNNNVQIGKYDSSLWEFNGTIDEVKMYNRALSQSEIKQLYNMGR